MKLKIEKVKQFCERNIKTADRLLDYYTNVMRNEKMHAYVKGRKNAYENIFKFIEKGMAQSEAG